MSVSKPNISKSTLKSSNSSLTVSLLSPEKNFFSRVSSSVFVFFV